MGTVTLPQKHVYVTVGGPVTPVMSLTLTVLITAQVRAPASKVTVSVTGYGQVRCLGARFIRDTTNFLCAILLFHYEATIFASISLYAVHYSVRG